MLPKTIISNVPQGRKLFGEALSSLEYLADDNSIENRGFILSQWSYCELQNGNVADGQRLLEQARGEFTKMDPRNPRRKYELDLLNQNPVGS
jgi:hypothetical protein